MNAATRSGGGRAVRSGVFITFEGGEGVGKSTQIRLLANRLHRLGRRVTVSREPGGTRGAEAIRHVVLDQAALESFGPAIEAIMFAAARSDHVEQVIKPALARGDAVLVDRFMDSTRVYQGMSGNLDPDFMASLERVAINATVPDLTVILNLDPEIGLARARSRRGADAPVDRFEKETLQVHRARRDAFARIAADEPDRCKLIDAGGEPHTVAEAIWRHVAPLIEADGDRLRAVAGDQWRQPSESEPHG